MSFKLLKKKMMRDGIARAKASGLRAASKRAHKFRGRRRCKPSEEAAGQARVIVNDDPPTCHADLIQNHLKAIYSTRAGDGETSSRWVALRWLSAGNKKARS
jgi:hypothetical protein